MNIGQIQLDNFSNGLGRTATQIWKVTFQNSSHGTNWTTNHDGNQAFANCN